MHFGNRRRCRRHQLIARLPACPSAGLVAQFCAPKLLPLKIDHWPLVTGHIE